MLLAIDTATRLLSLALHDGKTLLAEQTWTTGNQHTTLLADAISMMLDACEVKHGDISALACSIGPGSYTGLRIGVSLAKGMAAARGLPLVGISSLDTLAAAQPFLNTRHRLIAAVQAGRGRIIAAEYRVKKGRWMAESEPQLTDWASLLKDLEGTYYITGEVDTKGRDAIEAARTDALGLTLVDASYRLRRAGFLAQEAWRVLRAGSPADFDPALVMPVYLKSPG